MKLLSLLKSAVHNADFFSTTQLIRYQQQPEFKTFTGGIFSLLIVILLSAIFGSMSLAAVRREHIDWSGQTGKDAILPRLNLSFSTFNIGVELEGFNLSAPLQYFDVVMTLQTYQNKTLQGGGLKVPLAACRREDWAVNDDVLGNFDRMNGSNWLCPNFNSSFFIEGKWTSDHFTYLSIDVKECGSVNRNATCASKTAIDQSLQSLVHFSVYYINSLITPDKKEPISYYLEDKDYVYFGKKLGGANYIFISDYSITTDHSIFPYSNSVEETGGIVMLPTRISVQEVTKNWYASIVFRKATDRYIFTRSFTKVDTVVSYTGGLFGALIGVLFLMNHYTRTSFQVALAGTIYSNQDSQTSDEKNMNLFRYAKYLVYKLLNFIGHPPKWNLYEGFYDCTTEIQKQLDIKFMLDKLNFLERAVNAICGEQKYKALHLRTQVTIADAERYRQYYFLKNHIINSFLKSKKEKNQALLLKEKEKPESSPQNQLQTPSSIFTQSPAFLSLGKSHVTPISAPKDQLHCGFKENTEIDQVNTNKLTGKTRRHIKQMKSYLSTLQSVYQQPESMEISDLVHALQEVKRESQGGDQLCRQIWSNLDEDIRIIFERKMSKHRSIRDVVLELQDNEKSVKQ